MNPGLVIPYLYPNAIPLVDFRHSGGVITYWNTQKLGAEPSQATLDANWLPALKAYKERELQVAANQEFLDSEYVFQGIIVGVLWAHNTALNATEQAIFDSMNARYTKLKAKITAVRNATTQAQIEAVVWA